MRIENTGIVFLIHWFYSSWSRGHASDMRMCKSNIHLKPIFWERKSRGKSKTKHVEKVKIEFDVKKSIWESESWQMMWLLCVKCCLAVMERSRMIEWVNNDDNDNDEDWGCLFNLFVVTIMWSADWSRTQCSLVMVTAIIYADPRNIEIPHYC